jgi:uncharacterized protein YqgC (DUF456 family)
MTLFWIIFVGVLFTLAGVVCIVLTAMNLPGAWILLGLAFVIEILDRFYLPLGERQTFSWWLLIACVVLAGIGELLELGASALGASSRGSTRYGVIGAILGGIVGAVGGTAIPVPILGTLVGAVIGTFLGAIVGELMGGKQEVQDAIAPATGATIGRILGTLAKVPIVTAIWASLAVSAFWR